MRPRIVAGSGVISGGVATRSVRDAGEGGRARTSCSRPPSSPTPAATRPASVSPPTGYRPPVRASPHNIRRTRLRLSSISHPSPHSPGRPLFLQPSLEPHRQADARQVKGKGTRGSPPPPRITVLPPPRDHLCSCPSLEPSGIGHRKFASYRRPAVAASPAFPRNAASLVFHYILLAFS